MLSATRSQANFDSVAAGVILAGTAALLSGALVAVVQPSLNVALLIGIVVVISTPLIVRVIQGKFDPFEPTCIFFLAWGTMFALRPTVSLLSGEFSYTRTSRVIDLSSTYSEMLGMALVGAAAFLVGYAISGDRESARKVHGQSDFHTGIASVSPAMFACVGAASLALFVMQAGGLPTILSGRSPELTAAIQNSSTYLWTAPFMLAPASLAFLVLWRTRRNGLFLAAALVVGLLLLLRVLPVGSRILLLPLSTGLLVPLLTRSQRRPTAVQMASLLVIGLFLSFLLLNHRESRQRADVNIWSSMVGVISEPVGLLRPVLYGADAEMSETLAGALTVIPEETGHTLGAWTVGDLLTRPVPRRLWQGKPEIPRRQLIATLWPAEIAGKGVGGSANPEFSVLLFWYADFSWIGIVAGMMAYGALARYFYERFLLHSRGLQEKVLYGLILGLLVIALRDSPVDTIVRAMFIVAPFWMIFGISRKKVQSRCGEITG
jgi:hypothetical protein